MAETAALFLTASSATMGMMPRPCIRSSASPVYRRPPMVVGEFVPGAISIGLARRPLGAEASSRNDLALVALLALTAPRRNVPATQVPYLSRKSQVQRSSNRFLDRSRRALERDFVRPSWEPPECSRVVRPTFHSGSFSNLVHTPSLLQKRLSTAAAPNAPAAARSWWASAEIAERSAPSPLSAPPE